MATTVILTMIRNTYGSILISVAAQFSHRPGVLAGIMMRESLGGLALDPLGPAGTGDGGHGRGLMQIDDRSFRQFCSGDSWKDPDKNIAQGAAVLRDIRAQVQSECRKFAVPANLDQVERLSIAGYNCGADLAVHAFRHGEEIDKYTTGGDYSAAVLAFAEEYRIMPPNDSPVNPERRIV
jgi:membrane-bound lytic murein transglycosylase MltF